MNGYAQTELSVPKRVYTGEELDAMGATNVPPIGSSASYFGNPLLLAILIIGAIALVGFFRTKAKGLGRFTTSTLLLLLVIIIAALLFSAGQLHWQVMANILFAVIGFAGGLFTAKDSADRGP